MEPKDFNDIFLQNLIEKLSFENKNIILMGDFNIDILKYDTNKDSEEFLDKMYTNFLLPYITSPSRVTPRSQTLIDNFFSNIIEEGSNSGNLNTTISDHFVQFVLFITEKKNKCNSKDTKYIRDFKNLNKENFESDIKETKWDEILELNKGNVDLSSKNFLKTFDSIIDKHLPLRKLTIQEKKLSQKRWITTGILNSIKNKNRKYIENINEQRMLPGNMTYIMNSKLIEIN